MDKTKVDDMLINMITPKVKEIEEKFGNNKPLTNIPTKNPQNLPPLNQQPHFSFWELYIKNLIINFIWHIKLHYIK